MNHLAHLFLAGPSAESLIGNLAGDFVKGPLATRFSEPIAEGIRNHRRVDAFTDSHPSVAAFRRVLVPEHGHYARIISDVFFDHFLASDFERYAGEPLESFLARVFSIIDEHEHELPGRLAFVYPHLRDEGWIPSYRTIEGVELTLRQISRRLSRKPRLETAARHLVDSREELSRHFHDFFPDAIRFVSS